MSFTFGSWADNAGATAVVVSPNSSIDATAFSLDGAIAAQFAAVVQPAYGANGGYVEVQPLRDTGDSDHETSPTDPTIRVAIPTPGDGEARQGWVLPATFGGSVVHRVFNRSGVPVTVTIRQKAATS